MLTSNRYTVCWCYQEGDRIKRRSLSSYERVACIEAARIIFCHPYSSDVEVLEIDTGKSIAWKAPKIGAVLVDEDIIAETGN